MAITSLCQSTGCGRRSGRKHSLGPFRAPRRGESTAFDLGQEAIVGFLSHFSGQKEEKFFWAGAGPFGSGYVLAGRVGGPSSQAETLVPVFLHMLNTLKLAPAAEAGSGGEGTTSFDLAWGPFQSATAAEMWKAWGAGTSYYPCRSGERPESEWRSNAARPGRADISPGVATVERFSEGRGGIA